MDGWVYVSTLIRIVDNNDGGDDGDDGDNLHHRHHIIPPTHSPSPTHIPSHSPVTQPFEKRYIKPLFFLFLSSSFLTLFAACKTQCSLLLKMYRDGV